MKVLAIIANGFEELEAIGSIALLKRSGIHVDIVSFEGNEVQGKHNIYVSHLQDAHTKRMDDYDCLLLPGGPHFKTLEKSTLVKGFIEQCFQQSKVIAAICAAPTILGRLGYLKNKHYTCFTSMNDDFGGTYVDQYVVVDENIISARSAAASIAFALTIIEVLQGKAQAEKIKKEIYY